MDNNLILYNNGQYELSFIEHNVEEVTINQRAFDGYINATALCKACNKKINDYLRLNNTKEFCKELSSETGIPVSELIQVIKGGVPEAQGTWVHPQVAINLAQWASPKFAVFVSKWVIEWTSGKDKNNYRLPYHIRRYLINNEKIPSQTHFSMLNEMTILLLAPLEKLGYELPISLMPDISMGRLFSKWCRDKGFNPEEFPTYEHVFDDGKRPPVQARLYPNKLLSDFREYFHNEWLKKRAIEYFKKKDEKAVKFIAEHIKKLN